MFRLDPTPDFWTTVKVRQPGEDAATDTFRARFRALPIDEFNSFDLAAEEGTRNFLLTALIDVDQIEDMDGKPYRFSLEFAATLVNVAHVRAGLVAAYLTAYRDAVAGN